MPRVRGARCPEQPQESARGLGPAGRETLGRGQGGLKKERRQHRALPSTSLLSLSAPYPPPPVVSISHLVSRFRVFRARRTGAEVLCPLLAWASWVLEALSRAMLGPSGPASGPVWVSSPCTVRSRTSVTRPFPMVPLGSETASTAAPLSAPPGSPCSGLHPKELTLTSTWTCWQMLRALCARLPNPSRPRPSAGERSPRLGPTQTAGFDSELTGSEPLSQERRMRRALAGVAQWTESRPAD